MAWNQVSVTLWPPAWNPKIVTLGSAMTASEKPVRLIDHESIGGAHHLLVEEVLNWLVNHGATLQSTTTNLARLEYGDVSILVAKQNDSEIVTIDCQFRLTKTSDGELRRWLDYISGWPEGWCLRVLDTRTGEKRDLTALREIITSSPNWQHFANNFGWPKPQ
jgi:hypothetical protein